VLAGVLVLACGAYALRAMHGRGKAEEKTGPIAGLDAGRPGHRQRGRQDLSAATRRRESYLVIATGTARGKHGPAGSGTLFEKPNGNITPRTSPRAAAVVPEATMELCGLHRTVGNFRSRWSTNPLAAEKGLVVTSAIRDITERKQVEQRISKLNQELEHHAMELEKRL